VHGESVNIRPRIALVLALLLVATAYVPAIDAWFVKDDLLLLLGANTEPVENFLSPWLGGFYRPLARTLFGLQFAIFGFLSWPYHVVSITIHLACCLFVFTCARAYGAAQPTAVAAMLIFGLHPGGTETVAWISGQMSLVASCGMLATLAIVLRVSRCGYSRLYVPLAGVTTAVSCLCYETGALTPLFCSVALLGMGSKRSLRASYPVILTSVAVVLMYLLVRAGLTGALAGPYSLHISAFTLSENLAYFVYLLMGGTAIGGRMAAYTPEKLLTLDGVGWVVPPLLVTTLIVAAIAYRRTTTEAGTVPSLKASLLLAAVAIAPLLFLDGRPRRLLYPALVPFALWAAAYIDMNLTTRHARLAVTLFLVVAFSTTASRAMDWTAAGRVELSAYESLRAHLETDYCEAIVVDVPNQLGDALFFHISSLDLWLRSQGHDVVGIRHSYTMPLKGPQECFFRLTGRGEFVLSDEHSTRYRRGSNWISDLSP
jgi:hypothetical protein